MGSKSTTTSEQTQEIAFLPHVEPGSYVFASITGITCAGFREVAFGKLFDNFIVFSQVQY